MWFKKYRTTGGESVQTNTSGWLENCMRDTFGHQKGWGVKYAIFQPTTSVVWTDSHPLERYISILP